MLYGILLLLYKICEFHVTTVKIKRCVKIDYDIIAYDCRWYLLPSLPPPEKRCHDVSIVGNCVVGGEGGGGGGVLCESFPEQLWTAQ